jgi:surfactin synthase thioesterase subunit
VAITNRRSETTLRFSVPLKSRRKQGPLLVCFPHAGGRSASLREVARNLPDDFAVVGIDLPGRGASFRLPPYENLHRAVEALVEGLWPELTVPFALLGHSLGGLLAFECARSLQRAGVSPAHLFVSACSAPRNFATAALSQLSKPELTSYLREMGGTPADALASDELIDVLLPMLRADLAMADGYHYTAGDPLACPISVLIGARDAAVTLESVAAWQHETSAPYTCEVLDGGHFWFEGNEIALASIVSARLLATPGKV